MPQMAYLAQLIAILGYYEYQYCKVPPDSIQCHIHAVDSLLRKCFQQYGIMDLDRNTHGLHPYK